jgi:UDP-N-acetylglucosamine 2-epimerase (non-hydrolysing)
MGAIGNQFAVVFGTRPEALKLWPVVEALRRAGASIRLCSTGQHRDLLNQIVQATNLAPDIDLRVMEANQSLSGLTCRLLSSLSELFDRERPERLIVQGDTCTAFAAALAAHHLQIPVAHVEAGLRSGDNRQPWPEEFNRKAISAIADMHFAPTEHAAQTLFSEGQPAERVFVTGNTAIDALFATRARISADPALCEPVRPVLERSRGKHLILVTCHRRENLHDPLLEIAAGLRALAARKDVHIVLPTHPNPVARERLSQALAGVANIELPPPLDHACFVRLLAAAHIVLTDSGGIQEEAPAMGKPVLVLRDRTERIEAVLAGSSRLIGTRAQRIAAETCRLLDNPTAHARMARLQSPYGDGRAGERIAAILTGNSDVVGALG